MPTNHAAAIIRWRDHLDLLPGGLRAFEQVYTVNTMLFGCHRWLERNASDSSQEERDRILGIKAELETWMTQRGQTYRL